MKKSILVLGLLASLVMLVGCAKSTDDAYDDFDYDSYVASGDFTITEESGICPDQQWAKNNNYPKMYVNNITMLGQTNKVIVQSDFSYRKSLL